MEQFLGILVVYSDTALAGHYLGEADLAAMSLLAYIMWLVPSLFAVVAIGATAMTARFAGAGQMRWALRATNQALLLGAGLTAAVMLALAVWGDELIGAMNLSGPAAAKAEIYLAFVIPVLPAIMLTQIGPACLRGAGDTVSGAIAMGLVNVVNIAASWALVLGLAGLPQLGWEGLAWGTALGHLLGGAVMLWFLVRGRAGLRIQPRFLRYDRELARRLLRIGVPGGGDTLMVVVCHMWFVSIIFQLGATQAAAHGVAVRIESLAYLPGIAFQVAAATMAGQYLGAGDPQRASRGAWTACLVCAGVMSAAGLVFFFAARPLTMVFTGQANVIETSVPLLKIVAVAMPAMAVTTALSGALRGAGDTRWPFAFTMIGLLGVRIPAAYALTLYFPLGIQGAWYAMVADIWIRCPLVLARFLHGGWKRIDV